MKKLFTVRNCMLLRVDEEGAVYSFYDNESEAWRFCNSEGTVLSQYEGSIHQVEDWINYDDGEEMRYNKYGVALADGCLVDQDGNQIPDTELNCVDDCDENNRYFVFTLLSEEQERSIDACGTAEHILLYIYDTKTRKYVAKDVPECKLRLSYFDGENEVVEAAVALVEQYDDIALEGKGTLIAYKGQDITVYDFYQ